MKNTLVILLSMIILLLSFFVFEGGSELIGFHFLEGGSQFIEKKEECAVHPSITTICISQLKVKRGARTFATIVPRSSGVHSEFGLYEGENRVGRFFLCDREICTKQRNNFPIYISRTAVKPSTPERQHELRFVDVRRGIVAQKIQIL